MLLSCHFSFLTKTPSATEPFAASRVGKRYARRVHLDVTSTPLMPRWCSTRLKHTHTHRFASCINRLPLTNKHSAPVTRTIFALSHTYAHISSVPKQRPSLPSAWLISLCNHQRCALWECLLGQGRRDRGWGIHTPLKDSQRETEVGAGEGERQRKTERYGGGPVTGNERWHFKEEAEFHLQLP